MADAREAPRNRPGRHRPPAGEQQRAIRTALSRAEEAAAVKGEGVSTPEKSDTIEMSSM